MLKPRQRWMKYWKELTLCGLSWGWTVRQRAVGHIRGTWVSCCFSCVCDGRVCEHVWLECVSLSVGTKTQTVKKHSWKLQVCVCNNKYALSGQFIRYTKMNLMQPAINSSFVRIYDVVQLSCPMRNVFVFLNRIFCSNQELYRSLCRLVSLLVGRQTFLTLWRPQFSP